jgi:proteasome beta subunit
MELKENEKMLKTGTTTVGILCTDGVVLASDKRSSAGYMIANKKQVKIVQISDKMAITQAGLVSDAQLLSKIARAEIKLKDIQTNRSTSVKEAANIIAGLLYANIRKMSMVPGIVGFILGGADGDGYHIYELGVDGSVTKFDDFVSDGSGSVYALGVLEAEYKEGITVEQGIALAEKAIGSSLKRDMATGNGIDVIKITQKGFEKVFTKSLKHKLE